MAVKRRILAMGGHDFDRRPGNQALCDEIVTLSGEAQPKVCLLPTAGGDAEDQIGRFRRAFGERGADPSDISLFRLGSNPIEFRSHLLAQDVIYVSGGSMVNLLAIWRAHKIDAVLRQAYEAGVLIVGQSAGAMCWFEAGVTKSSGMPQACRGLGLLEGSASVHYHLEPDRADLYREAVASGMLPPGYGLDDQAGVLFEDEEMVKAYSAREGAGVWRVVPEGGGAEEIPVEAEEIRDAESAIGDIPAEIIELRQTLAAQTALRRGRRRMGSGPGRM
jgi:dipeptidase E